MSDRLVPVAALLVLTLLAGCSAAGSLSMNEVTDRELASNASRSLDDLPARGGDGEAALLRGAVENGSASMTAQNPPLSTETPVRYRGRYYNLSRTVTDRQPGVRVGIGVDYNASEVSGDRIAYEDLPEPDREAVSAFFPPSSVANRRVEGVDFGTSAVYTEAELDESVLARSQRYDAVVYEGEAYPIDVRDAEDVTLKTYRYRSTEIAASASAYGAEVREEYAFTLSNLNESERAVVTEAIDGGYYAEDTDDAAFASLVDRFRDHRAFRADEYGGRWVVRYRGSVYWARLRFGEFVMDER